jgi:hypothetical protein
LPLAKQFLENFVKDGKKRAPRNTYYVTHQDAGRKGKVEGSK